MCDEFIVNIIVSLFYKYNLLVVKAKYLAYYTLGRRLMILYCPKIKTILLFTATKAAQGRYLVWYLFVLSTTHAIPTLRVRPFVDFLQIVSLLCCSLHLCFYNLATRSFACYSLSSTFVLHSL